MFKFSVQEGRFVGWLFETSFSRVCALCVSAFQKLLPNRATCSRPVATKLLAFMKHGLFTLLSRERKATRSH